MNYIKETIYKIGEEMIKNHPHYPDTVYDLDNGIIPRCLIYEEKSRDFSVRGSVIVGINPGRSKKDEQVFYKDHGNSYDAVLEYWNKKIKNLRYYAGMKSFVDSVDLTGPILWTELVKCESPKDVKLSTQTIRDSIHMYLFEELKVIPKNWPLVAVGNEAFKILSYRFPNRTVLGIPHITGSYGQFSKLFSKNKIDASAKRQLEKVLAENKPIATEFKCVGGVGRFDIDEI